MEIIAFTAQKGGTAKTTSCCGLGHCLNELGKSVLLIDLDGQQNLSYFEGVNTADLHGTLYEVWTGKKFISEVLYRLSIGLDLIRGGLSLTGADLEFSGRKGRERMLSQCLDGIRSQYDYILIDSPPNLGLLTQNACTVANHVVIPCGIDSLSIQGLSQLMDFLFNVKKYYNHDLDVLGVLMTMVDESISNFDQLQKEIHDIATEQDIRVFETMIHYSKPIKRYTSQQNPDVFQKKYRASADYRAWAQEVLAIMGDK